MQSTWRYSVNLSRLSGCFCFPRSSLDIHEPATFVKYIQTLTRMPASDISQDIKRTTLVCCKNTLSTHNQMMDASILLPPPIVRGMTELDRGAFQKKIKVPHVIVNSSRVQYALKYLKKYLLKLKKIKPVQCEKDHPERKLVLLNPLMVDKYEDIKEEFLSVYGGDDAVCEYRDVVLQYENWEALDTLKAVLPENQEGAQGYSIIGHILHLNLRDHLWPYKHVIGEVFLDKIPNISLVVNKTKEIDSTYRNFQMEVLAGTGDTYVNVKENGCTFAMDFAKVYWNPRLSTEHERIAKKLVHGDVLYDVMAGIGPFAIPAARKKCYVLANDLNPSSFNALVKNCSLNKVKERIKCFNLDGQEFIKTILKKDLLEKWEELSFSGDVHITMNLPAMAVEFLPAYIGLFHDIDCFPDNPTLPIIHVYMFTKEANEDIAIGMVAEKLGYSDSNTSNSEVRPKTDHHEEKPGNNQEAVAIHEDSTTTCVESTASIEKETNEDKMKIQFGGLREHVLEVMNVRNVAPNKTMMRVSLRLPKQLLTTEPSHWAEPPCKKIKAV